MAPGNSLVNDVQFRKFPKFPPSALSFHMYTCIENKTLCKWRELRELQELAFHLHII